jgi:proline utilization trans-activator
LKCTTAKAACEYVEGEKKIVVSMKYLQKLHDDIAKLKKENAHLKANTKPATIVDKKSADTDGARPKLKEELQTNSVAPGNVFDLENVVESSDMGVVLNATFQDNTASNSVNDTSKDEIVAPFLNQQHKLVYSRTGQKFYVGSSSMTLFGIQVQNMISHTNYDEVANPEVPSLTVTETVLEREGNAYRIMLGKTKNKPGVSVNFTMPSYSYAMLLVDTFIQYNDGCFYFFNEGVVKENLRRVYDGIGSDDKSDSIIETIWFCKVLLIFSVGEMYLGTANNINGNKLSQDDAKLPGSGFFHQATELFTGLFSSGAIDNLAREGGIEVLLLYAFYLQVADCTVASYFYFGLALRASLILGMHVDADKENVTRYELEHRRRLWWTVYMYERMLSSKAGLPLSLSDSSIGTELPDDFDMFNPPPGCEHYIFPEAEYITSCVKITQINAKILSCLYQRQPDTNILPVLAELVGQLIEWKQNLPDFLKQDFSQKDLQISRLNTNIMSEYFQGINLAVRPLLFHFASKQLKTNQKKNQYIDLNNYSKSIITLFNSSFQASINTIRALWSLMPDNMVALFGYMDREYLFTSAATLILFNAAFGVHQATIEHLDHAMQIFSKMRNLGNHPSALRRAQLLKLMTALDFNGLMSTLIAKHDDDPNEYSNSLSDSPKQPQNARKRKRDRKDSRESSHQPSQKSLLQNEIVPDHLSESPTPNEQFFGGGNYSNNYPMISQPNESSIRNSSDHDSQSTNSNKRKRSLNPLLTNSPVLHPTQPEEIEVPVDTLRLFQPGTETEGETELWKEISNEAMWLNSLGDTEGFQSLVDDFII